MAHKNPVSRHKAKEILKHGEVRDRPLSKKQKGLFGAIAGGAKVGHRSPAENVEAFDESALGETPPRRTLETGHPTRDSLPSATGRPAGVRTAEGTEPLADAPVTKQSAPRAQAGNGSKRWPAGVTSYTDDRV